MIKNQSYLIKKRVIWTILFAILGLILIPSGIALANNNETKKDNATIQISGTITAYYTFGKYFPSVCAVGWDVNGDFYRSEPVTTAADGKYTLTDIPDNITGLIEVTCDQCQTGFKVLPHETKNSVDFDLKEGVKGPFNDSNDLEYYVIKAGSTYTDVDGSTLNFNKDLKLLKNNIKYKPDQAFCFADKSELIPDHTNGTLTYKFESSNSPEKINVTFTCKGVTGKVFSNFIIKDRVRIFTYNVKRQNNPVPVVPIFTSNGTMSITGNFRGSPGETEEILQHNPYVFAVWFDLKTEEIGFKNGEVAQELSNEGAYGFTDIPDTAVGAVVGGASGYFMDFGGPFYYSPGHDSQRIDLSIPEGGAKFTINQGEGFSNAVLAAGTKIYFNGEDVPYVLEKDFDLGSEFPPFGLLVGTNLKFNEDGTVEYTYAPAHPEQHEITGANIILKTIPKAGYQFGHWLLNDVKVSGNYTVQDTNDVIVVPAIDKTPGPQPGPSPVVDPTKTPQTGDMTHLVIIAIIMAIALVADLVTKKRLLNWK